MISEDLAKFIHGLKFELIPDSVIRKTKDLILDLVGCAFGGTNTAPAFKIYNTLRTNFCTGKATIWGRNVKTSGLLAALVNAAASHSLVLDDTRMFHPGTVIIPSAIAVGETEAVDGKKLIEAIVSGYEISIRIARSLGTSHRERGWRATGTIGTFGAAAAASKLLNLDIDKTATSLGLAGCQASGLWVGLAEGTMSIVLDAGRAAFNGILSALLAQESFTGPHSIFEAEDAGFCKAMSDVYDLSGITEGLGTDYEIIQVETKPYGTSRGLQAPIEATIRLMDTYSIVPEEIDSIIVRTDKISAIQYVRYKPKNIIDAKLSLPYTIALAIIDKELLMPMLPSAKQLTDSKTLALARRVIVETDTRFRRPSHACEVEIKTIDGKRFLQYIETPRGQKGNPLTRKELHEKFRKLTETSLGRLTTNEIMKEIYQIDKLKNIKDFTCLLERTDGV